MGTTEVVIFNNYSTSCLIDTKWVARTIPANDKNALHHPTVRRSEFAVELSVAIFQANYVINFFRADITTAASG